jgi:short-subunit dehydrogenase
MIALVTGATSGIGKAIATMLAKKKWNLIITGRRLQRLIDLQKELVDSFGIDVKINFDIRNLLESYEVLKDLGRKMV